MGRSGCGVQGSIQSPTHHPHRLFPPALHLLEQLLHGCEAEARRRGVQQAAGGDRRRRQHLLQRALQRGPAARQHGAGALPAAGGALGGGEGKGAVARSGRTAGRALVLRSRVENALGDGITTKSGPPLQLPASQQAVAIVNRGTHLRGRSPPCPPLHPLHSVIP